MTVELIVRIKVPGPVVTETLAEEQAIEAMATKEVVDALEGAGVYLIGVTLLNDEIADAIIAADGSEEASPIHSFAI